MTTLFAQIRLSSKIDDLDDAIRPIQAIIGQDDGGLASHYFDYITESWSLIDEKERERWIIRYIGFELECFEKMETV